MSDADGNDNNDNENDNNLHTRDIDASVPVADEAARAGQLGADAPAIRQGHVRHFEDFLAARDETRSRKRLKAYCDEHPEYGRVTTQEIARSKLREISVAIELNKGADGPNQPVTNAGLQAAMQQLEQNLRQGRRQGLRQLSEEISIMRKNDSIRLSNGLAIISADKRSYQALWKEKAGWGPQLHGYGVAADGAADPIGTKCRNFPENDLALSTLSKDEIGQLSIFYNDDFGIQADDELPEWRNKLKHFITHAS